MCAQGFRRVQEMECSIKWLRRKPARGNGVVGADPLPKDGGECGQMQRKTIGKGGSNENLFPSRQK